MHQARNLFHQSIEQYQSILDAVHDLAPDIESGLPERLRRSIERLESLQEDAARTDTVLNETLQEIELLERRQTLMNELGRMNRMLVSQLESRMALIANDLLQGRRARRAMSGYRCNNHTAGALLTERF